MSQQDVWPASLTSHQPSEPAAMGFAAPSPAAGAPCAGDKAVWWYRSYQNTVALYSTVRSYSKMATVLVTEVPGPLP